MVWIESLLIPSLARAPITFAISAALLVVASVAVVPCVWTARSSNASSGAAETVAVPVTEIVFCDVLVAVSDVSGLAITIALIRTIATIATAAK